jgi:hypothetical protein
MRELCAESLFKFSYFPAWRSFLEGEKRERQRVKAQVCHARRMGPLYLDTGHSLPAH